MEKLPLVSAALSSKRNAEKEKLEDRFDVVPEFIENRCIYLIYSVTVKSKILDLPFGGRNRESDQNCQSRTTLHCGMLSTATKRSPFHRDRNPEATRKDIQGGQESLAAGTSVEQILGNIWTSKTRKAATASLASNQRRYR